MKVKLSLGRTIRGAIIRGTIILRSNLSGINHPQGQQHSRAIFWEVLIQAAIIFDGKYPWGQLFGGDYLRG